MAPRFQFPTFPVNFPPYLIGTGLPPASSPILPVSYTHLDVYKRQALYKQMDDKQWGLVDCISFVIMRERGVTEALTSDHHFVQAGFRVLFSTQG